MDDRPEKMEMSRTPSNRRPSRTDRGDALHTDVSGEAAAGPLRDTDAEDGRKTRPNVRLGIDAVALARARTNDVIRRSPGDHGAAHAARGRSPTRLRHRDDGVLFVMWVALVDR